MALDLRQNYVSAHYLENKLTEFHQTYILTRSRLGLTVVIWCLFVTGLWPLIYARISFPLNIVRTKEWNLTKLDIIFIDNI